MLCDPPSADRRPRTTATSPALVQAFETLPQHHEPLEMQHLLATTLRTVAQCVGNWLDLLAVFSFCSLIWSFFSFWHLQQLTEAIGS